MCAFMENSICRGKEESLCLFTDSFEGRFKHVDYVKTLCTNMLAKIRTTEYKVVLNAVTRVNETKEERLGTAVLKTV